MSGGFRRGLSALSGLALAGGLLWWVFRRTPMDSLLAALGDVDPLLLLVAAAVHLAHLPLRVLRWGTLLNPVAPRVSRQAMLDATLIGFTASLLAPGRIGELVRPATLSWRDERVPLAPAVGSVLTERILDGLSVVLFFAVGLLWSGLPRAVDETSRWVRTSALGLAGLFGLAVLALLLGLAFRPTLRGWSGRGPRPWRWLLRSLLAGLEGSAALTRPSTVARLAIESIGVWGLISCGIWLALKSNWPQLSYAGVLVLLPLISLGVALPTPAGSGGYHAAVTFGLTRLASVPQGVAVGAAVVSHLAIVLPLLSLGGLALARGRLPLGEIIARARHGWRRSS